MARSRHPQRANSDGRWQLRSYVLDRRDYNEMRTRLPRAVRRDVEPAPEGHVGLVVQAVTGDTAGTPLAVLYDSSPPVTADQRVDELAQRLKDLFG